MRDIEIEPEKSVCEPSRKLIGRFPWERSPSSAACFRRRPFIEAGATEDGPRSQDFGGVVPVASDATK